MLLVIPTPRTATTRGLSSLVASRHVHVLNIRSTSTRHTGLHDVTGQWSLQAAGQAAVRRFHRPLAIASHQKLASKMYTAQQNAVAWISHRRLCRWNSRLLPTYSGPLRCRTVGLENKRQHYHNCFLIHCAADHNICVQW